jgi:hypothetical protein
MRLAYGVLCAALTVAPLCQAAEAPLDRPRALISKEQYHPAKEMLLAEMDDLKGSERAVANHLLGKAYAGIARTGHEAGFRRQWDNAYFTFMTADRSYEESQVPPEQRGSIYLDLAESAFRTDDLIRAFRYARQHLNVSGRLEDIAAIMNDVDFTSKDCDEMLRHVKNYRAEADLIELVDRRCKK